MIRLIKFIILMGVLIFIGFCGYKFFFDCNEKVTDFGKYFVLEGYDYAKVGDILTVKLLKIEDNRCLEESCEREGQFVVKFLVKDDRHIAIEKLGSLSESKKDLTDHKLNYSIELIETDGKSATFNVENISKKK